MDKFYAYLAERERIRILKKSGAEPPWTNDQILRDYKFTNVKRINDRTTRHFAKIYHAHSSSPEDEALLNCAIRRYFGTMAWSDFVGWLHNPGNLLFLAQDAVAQGVQIFTGAYVITNGGRAERKDIVVSEYLRQLWVDSETIVTAIDNTATWEAGYDLLRQLPGFGGSGFMAKEVLQDYLIWMGYRNDALNRAPVEDYITDFWTFTPLGPGARRGLNRLAARPLAAPISPSAGAAQVAALRQYASPRFAEEFGQRLSAHDIQFCLCEYDKYERVRLGEGRPRSRYTARRET